MCVCVCFFNIMQDLYEYTVPSLTSSIAGDSPSKSCGRLRGLWIHGSPIVSFERGSGLEVGDGGRVATRVCKVMYAIRSHSAKPF